MSEAFFLHMCETKVVDLISATPLSIHIFVVLGKPFPFHFKMHDITLHIGSNSYSALKANAKVKLVRTRKSQI